jgi:putative salt-induced outer membrane protein
VAKEPGFFDLDSWDKSIDIGITGASGNSDNLNARVQLSAERKTSKMESKASALYRLSQSDGDNTENRFRFDLSNDWLPPEGSKIRWWARGAYEYDEFQAWDHRLSASGGLGYELINNDKHTLVGRLGLGGSQTFGDDNEEFRPELVAGLDYAYQIKENQRFVAGTEILLDVSDTDFWRTNSFARYEALIDPTNGLNFKTGITHRYDSEPGGDVDKSDFEYFATLGWTF